MLGFKDTEKKIPYIGAAIAGSSLVFNILLIPRYGILGAAVASAITATIEFVIKLVLVAKHLGSPISIFIKLFPYLLFTVISVVAIYLVNLENYAIYGALLAAAIYTLLCLMFKQLDPVLRNLLFDRLSFSKGNSND
jgi:O-antigen/teichoic acid export membrane protein